MKKFRLIALTLLAVLLPTSLSLAFAACGGGESCPHTITHFAEIDDRFHAVICSQCGNELRTEEHIFNDVYENGTYFECVCGYSYYNQGELPPEDDKPKLEDYYITYGLHSYGDSGIWEVVPQINIFYAENKVLEIPAAAPEKILEKDYNIPDPFIRKVEITCWEDSSFPGGSNEMFSSIILPDTVEEISVSVYAQDDADRVNPKYALFKGMCAQYDGGYYLGTADNAHYALVLADEADEVTLHADAKIMASMLFYRCFSNRWEHPKKVTLPDGFKRLSESAFSELSALSEVNIPSGIEVIPYNCFSHTALSGIEIPDTVTEICEHAFFDTQITSLVIPDSVKTVGKEILAGGSVLYSHAVMQYLELGGGITYIDPEAFNDYTEVLEVCNKSEVRLTADKDDDSAVYVNAHNIVTDPQETKIATDANGFKYLDLEVPVCFDYTGTDVRITFPQRLNGKAYCATPRFGGFAECEELTIPSSVHSWAEYFGEEDFIAEGRCTPKKITGSWRLIQDFQRRYYDVSAEEMIGTDEIVVEGNIEEKEKDRINFAKITLSSSVKSIVLTSTYGITADYLTAEKGALTNVDADALRIYVNKGIKASLDVIYKVFGYARSSVVLDTVEITSYDPSLEINYPYNCYQIKELIVDEGIQTLPNTLFYFNSDEEYVWLQKVTLPQSFRVIPANMLTGAQFEEIDLPQGITEIREGAFFGCRNLKTINLPSGLKKIGSEAFYNCDALELTELPDGLTYIGINAFHGAKIGEKEDGVVYLGKYAIGFDGSKDEVVLRENTEKLLDLVYYYTENNYPGVTSMTFPASLTEWSSFDKSAEDYADEAYQYNYYRKIIYPNLKEIAVNGDNARFSSFKGLLYDRDLTELIFVPVDFDPQEVEFPDTLSSLNSGKFSGTNALNEAWNNDRQLVVNNWVIYLPWSSDTVALDESLNYADGAIDAVKFTYKGGYYENYNDITLVSVQDKNVRFIVVFGRTKQVKARAFENCTKLYGAYFPDGLQKIEKGAFYGCTQGVNRYFAGQVPADSNGYADVDAQGAHMNGRMEFTGVVMDAATNNLYIADEDNPVELLLCGCADMLVDSINKVVMPDAFGGKTVGGIADFAFNGSPVQTLVMESLDNHTKTIGDQAFKDARDLSRIDVTNVVSIGAYAFSNAALDMQDSLSDNVQIKNTLGGNYVIDVGNNAFEYNTALYWIDFGTDKITFHNLAFNGCTALGHVKAGGRTEWWRIPTTAEGVGNYTPVTMDEQQLAVALKSNTDCMYTFLNPSALPTA